MCLNPYSSLCLRGIKQTSLALDITSCYSPQPWSEVSKLAYFALVEVLLTQMSVWQPYFDFQKYDRVFFHSRITKHVILVIIINKYILWYVEFREKAKITIFDFSFAYMFKTDVR